MDNSNALNNGESINPDELGKFIKEAIGQTLEDKLLKSGNPEHNGKRFAFMIGDPEEHYLEFEPVDKNIVKLFNVHYQCHHPLFNPCPGCFATMEDGIKMVTEACLNEKILFIDGRSLPTSPKEGLDFKAKKKSKKKPKNSNDGEIHENN